MKRLSLVLCLASLWTLPAHADGEERNFEVGTKWVDPVEFYELQDISRTDFQRDYDQGDIDFNKEIARKGVKVYGLRLKPVCAADYVEKFAHITEIEELNPVFNFEYQDLYGFRGVPIHEAGFCIYTDEGASRTYNFSYNWTMHHDMNVICERMEHNSSSATISLGNMRLVASGEGVAIAYSLNASNNIHSNSETDCHSDDGHIIRETDDLKYEFSKPDGVNTKLGHFIYFRGGRDLMLILGGDAMVISKLMKESEFPYLQRPWPRVYFIVEEILVADEGGPILSEEDRKELVRYLDDITTWLSGEGDPLGLGEHTDATTSAVINAIGTVVAILLGNGLASIVSGGAGNLVSSLTSMATSGAPPLPGGPNAPDLAKMDGLKPRRPEDEEKPDDAPPPPPEPEDPFSDVLNQYVTTDSDGDLNVKDPVTGKTTLYVSNGDGTYRNMTTGQDWTKDEIGEQLGFRDRNSGLLRQDADQAARNAAEQRAQWDAQNERDRERGYSDEMKEFRDWKAAQEAAEKKQEQLEKLAEKYGVPADEKKVKDAIKWEQTMNQMDAKIAMEEANAWNESTEYLEKVDKTCEVAVNVMGSCVPGGEVVKDAYTFAKATMVATSEAVASGKGAAEGVAHVLVGMGNGALGVIQNQAGNLAGEGKFAWTKELGINVLTEDLKEGINGLAEGKSIEEIGKKMIAATGSKTAEFGIGKLISGGLNKVGQRASDSLDATKIATMSDHNKIIFDQKSAKVLDGWLNKTHKFGVGPAVKTVNVSVGQNGINVWKGKGFGLFSGKINTRGLTEGVIGETVSNTVGYDWGGNLATGASNLAAEGAGSVAYGLGQVGQALGVGGADVVTAATPNDFKDITDFAKTVSKFSDAAAKYKKQQ